MAQQLLKNRLWQGLRKWLSSILFNAITISTVLIGGLLDINRYAGRCGHFNDSRGATVNGSYKCIANGNATGQLPGYLWPRSTRSRPAWIYVSLIYTLSSSLCCAALLSRARERNRNQKRLSVKIESERSPLRAVAKENLDGHTNELHRVCLIILLCTSLVFLYECIEVARAILCDRPWEEFAYHVCGGVNFLMQGAQLFFEARYQREQRSLLGWHKKVFVFLAVYNLMHWMDSIVNSICKVDVDNVKIVGEGIWTTIRPVLRSSMTFFRILSSSLYFTLAFHKKKRRTRDDDNGNAITETARESDVQRYGTNSDFSRRRLVDTLLACSFFGIPVVVLPTFICIVLTHINHYESVWGMKWIHISVHVVLNSISSAILFTCLTLIPNWRTINSKFEWAFDSEAIALTIFGVVSAGFQCTYVAYISQCREDCHAAGYSVISSILQLSEILLCLSLILLVKFKGAVNLESIEKHVVLISSLLAVEFTIGLSHIFLSIQREHTDRLIADRPILLGLMPFVVDFRVHSTLLTVSILVDVLQPPEAMRRKSRQYGTFFSVTKE
ncbi:uncharacterized protein [Oscarella lobularis]|uniref:uncharacterized protein n=1 Tax=Oscarella lobularis TaxID=121494 RepID=UPI0033143836